MASKPDVVCPLNWECPCSMPVSRTYAVTPRRCPGCEAAVERKLVPVDPVRSTGRGLPQGADAAGAVADVDALIFSPPQRQ